MNKSEAQALGNQLSDRLAVGEVASAYHLLEPILQERNKFDLLRLVGRPVGDCPFEKSDRFMDLIAAGKSIGGWVVIASILEGGLTVDRTRTFSRCWKYIVAGDTWYSTDSLAEGVTGKALVEDFQPSLQLLYPWRRSENRWVRRAVGVSVHQWAKRSHGDPLHQDKVHQLLELLEALFDEREMDAVKGVGWGLKTLGRYYPDLVAAWLDEQVVRGNVPHRVVMLRKAQTYLR